MIDQTFIKSLATHGALLEINYRASSRKTYYRIDGIYIVNIYELSVTNAFLVHFCTLDNRFPYNKTWSRRPTWHN